MLNGVSSIRIDNIPIAWIIEVQKRYTKKGYDLMRRNAEEKIQIF